MDADLQFTFPAFSIASGGSVSRQTGELAIDEHLSLVPLSPKAGEPHVMLFRKEALADELLGTSFANKGFRKFSIANANELIQFLERAAKTHQYVVIDPNPKSPASLSQPIANLIRALRESLEFRQN